LLHKGSLLNNSLAQLWRANGNYIGAAEAVSNAITQEHFASSNNVWSGVNVMTIHKAKGKEFDVVIVYEGSFPNERFVYGNYLDKARLVLRVAITRAKQETIVLTPQVKPCPLL
jgi:DNA helicase-2/ATP-dependent DNA helicase PcrA